MSTKVEKPLFVRKNQFDEAYIDDEEKKHTYKPSDFKWCWCVAQRYLMSFLCGIGFLLVAGMRCNMSVAIVAMTKSNGMINNNYINVSFMSSYYTNHLPEFTWTPETVGIVDSSYFWGYIVTLVPAGYLATRLPANRIFAIPLGTSAFLYLLLPVATRVHFGLVMAVRVMQGLLEGLSLPAFHGIWRFWAPPLERTKLVTISFSGAYVGAVVGMPISGILTKYLGWRAGFYVFGAFGIIWAVIFCYLTSESPASNYYITQEELIYIQTSLGESSILSTKSMKTPWVKFFTSMPVYAIFVATFCYLWTFFLLLISQPMYMTEVFHHDIAKSGMLSALPHLLMGIIVPIGGQIADYLREKSLLTTTAVRKLFNCGGFALHACFLFGVGVARNEITAMICLTLAVGFSGFACSGFDVNHLDIAPRYASILMGMSNGIGTLAAIICPILTELMTKDGTADQWQMVFIFASAVHVFGIIFYGFFASGEQQHWAEPNSDDTWRPEDTEPTEKFATYGAFKENTLVNKEYCHDINPMNKNIIYDTNNTSNENVTSKKIPSTYGHNSVEGPVYQTTIELVQVPSKDKYLTVDRDL